MTRKRAALRDAPRRGIGDFHLNPDFLSIDSTGCVY
jgi:hypothetical protein